jgi:glycosyltransferase involved in cell wall biosynthesis
MNNLNLTLSVIVPVYNAEQFVNIFMENFDFTHGNQIELILIDDGSDDLTSKILKKYTHLENVRVIFSSHNGSASARNIGLKASKGEYVIFSDIDDYLDIALTLKLANSMKLEQVEVLRNKYNLANFPNVKLNSKHPHSFNFIPFCDKYVLEYMGFWTYIFKRDVLIKYDLLFWPALSEINSKYFVIDDWFFLLSLLRSRLRIYQSDIVIYNYYVNASEDKRLKYIGQQKELIKCYFILFKDYKIRNKYLSKITWKYILLDIIRSIYFNVLYFKF